MECIKTFRTNFCKIKKIKNQRRTAKSEKISKVSSATCISYVVFLQVTSKTRRRYSVRGSQAAPSGAPLGSRKKSILKRQMVVTDEGEISIV